MLGIQLWIHSPLVPWGEQKILCAHSDLYNSHWECLLELHVTHWVGKLPLPPEVGILPQRWGNTKNKSTHIISRIYVRGTEDVSNTSATSTEEQSDGSQFHVSFMLPSQFIHTESKYLDQTFPTGEYSNAVRLLEASLCALEPTLCKGTPDQPSCGQCVLQTLIWPSQNSLSLK